MSKNRNPVRPINLADFENADKDPAFVRLRDELIEKYYLCSDSELFNVMEKADGVWVEKEYEGVMVFYARDTIDNIKCPRCKRYHVILDNYDNLCDRCIVALVNDFPDHESVPFILKSIKEQVQKYKV